MGLNKQNKYKIMQKCYVFRVFEIKMNHSIQKVTDSLSCCYEELPLGGGSVFVLPRAPVISLAGSRAMMVCCWCRRMLQQQAGRRQPHLSQPATAYFRFLQLWLAEMSVLTCVNIPIHKRWGPAHPCPLAATGYGSASRAYLCSGRSQCCVNGGPASQTPGHYSHSIGRTKKRV